jgi:hypothetical protein
MYLTIIPRSQSSHPKLGAAERCKISSLGIDIIVLRHTTRSAHPAQRLIGIGFEGMELVMQMVQAPSSLFTRITEEEGCWSASVKTASSHTL